MPLIRRIVTTALALGACSMAACDDASPRTAADTAMAIATPVSDGAATRELRIATAIDATIQDSISSTRNHVGDRVSALVSRNVMDDDGRVVIPAGAVVALRITALHRAAATTAAAAVITLDVLGITAGAVTFTPSASAGRVGFTLRPGASPSDDRELVVTAGTPITIRLMDALRIAAQ